jgi:OOP family OmpA-OmpF porin
VSPTGRHQRRGRRAALVAPILALGLLAPLAAPAYADDDPDLTRLNSATISADMLAGSVVDLSKIAVDAVVVLAVDGSVTGLQTTTEAAGTAVVTLTSDLLFEFAKADLTPASSAAIPSVAAGIAQGAAVAVDGYTDSLGGDGINIPLSQQRAQAVATALAAARPDLVLTVTGHGSADEVAPNTAADGGDNPVGRAQNRRVKLTYATQ